MKSRLVLRIITLLSCLLMFCSMSIAPIQADTNISAEEMNSFSSRTTESLLEEILDGSYEAYFIAANMPNTVYPYLRDNFEIFAEFESREDATEIMFARLDQLSDETDNGFQDEYWFILALLSQPVFEAELEIDDIFVLQNRGVTPLTITNEDFLPDVLIDGHPYMTVDEKAYPLCGGDGATLYYTIIEHSETAYADFEQQVLEQCGNIPKVSEETTRYNCHSYAWYNRSYSNPYWMLDISPFLNDRHYYEVTTSTAQVGDVVVYTSDNNPTAHSAIIYSISTGSSMVPTITCESKMGSGGVYRHDLRNVLDMYMNEGIVDFKIYHYTNAHTYTGYSYKYDSTYHMRMCNYYASCILSAHVYSVTSYTSTGHTLTCRMCGQTKTEAHTVNAQTGKCTKCAYTGPVSSNPILSLPPEIQTENCDHCAVTE